MSTEIAVSTPMLPAEIVEKLVLGGDLASLTPRQRVAYYVHRCEILGVDPGERPFELLRLDGNLVLYAGKPLAQALTRLNKLSIELKPVRIESGLVIVECRAHGPDGQYADNIGAVDLEDERTTKSGAEKRSWRANAIMKAVTKAERRAVLALCGVGLIDDSEVDSIRGARRVHFDLATGDIQDAEVIDDDPGRTGVLRALDVALDLLARAYSAPKASAWRSMLKALALEASVPADLRTDEAQEMLEQVRVRTSEQLRKRSLEAYAHLCELESADFAPAAWSAEWAAWLGLDEWPDPATDEQLFAVIDHADELIRKLSQEHAE